MVDNAPMSQNDAHRGARGYALSDNADNSGEQRLQEGRRLAWPYTQLKEGHAFH